MVSKDSNPGLKWGMRLGLDGGNDGLPSLSEVLRAGPRSAFSLAGGVEVSGSGATRRNPVLDDTALVGRLRYVLAHGVKESLVERSAEWPGLTCLPQLLGPARRVFQWFNWTRRWSKRESEGMAMAAEGRFAREWAEPVELELARLPCWEGLKEEPRTQGTPVLEALAVKAQHPHTRPEHLKKSPRPLGHAERRRRGGVGGISWPVFLPSPSRRVSRLLKFFDTLSDTLSGRATGPRACHGSNGLFVEAISLTCPCRCSARA
jgi:hypothetical protein